MESKRERKEDLLGEPVAGDIHSVPEDRGEVNEERLRPESVGATAEDEQTMKLREERLVAHKEVHRAGEVTIRKEVEELPGRLEVEAQREEVLVEHVPVGREVRERAEPRDEDGVLVIPVYEERLVVSKRLVLREEIRVQKVAVTERQVFEDRLRKERLAVDDPKGTSVVREQHPTDEDADQGDNPGFLENAVRKILD